MHRCVQMDDLTVQLLRVVEMFVVLAIDGDTVGLEVRPQSICKVGSDGVLDASALQVFNRALFADKVLNYAFDSCHCGIDVHVKVGGIRD